MLHEYGIFCDISCTCLVDYYWKKCVHTVMKIFYTFNSQRFRLFVFHYDILLLRYTSCVVGHPRDLKKSQHVVSVESSSLLH